MIYVAKKHDKMAGNVSPKSSRRAERASEKLHLSSALAPLKLRSEEGEKAELRWTDILSVSEERRRSPNGKVDGKRRQRLTKHTSETNSVIENVNSSLSH